MADIFLSYSREDRHRVEPLVAALEKAGLSVWWDLDLCGGERFTAETEARLNEARAIVVVWSEASVKSMWVADEAMVGRDKGNLVPVSLDSTLPPLGFRQIQMIAFDKWRGERDAPEIDALLSVLDRVAQLSAPKLPPPHHRFFLWRRHPWLFASLAAIVLGVGIAGAIERGEWIETALASVDAAAAGDR